MAKNNLKSNKMTAVIISVIILAIMIVYQAKRETVKAVQKLDQGDWTFELDETMHGDFMALSLKRPSYRLEFKDGRSNPFLGGGFIVELTGEFAEKVYKEEINPTLTFKFRDDDPVDVKASTQAVGFGKETFYLRWFTGIHSSSPNVDWMRAFINNDVTIIKFGKHRLVVTYKGFVNACKKM